MIHVNIYNDALQVDLLITGQTMLLHITGLLIKDDPRIIIYGV